MPQLTRRELRITLSLIVGLASTSLVATVWFCETQYPNQSGSQFASLNQFARSHLSHDWQPVISGIELANGPESAHKIEWVHPEDEVKTERSKILKGLEASF